MPDLLRFSSYSCICMVLFLGACAQKDSISPSVAILQPLAGATYVVYDTVTVSFTAMDETQLVSLSAKLLNSDLIPVTRSSTIQVHADAGAYTATLIIDDKLIPTGDYFVLITASDGRNEQREYRQIRILGLPKQRRAVYFSTGNGGGNGAVYKVDSSFQQVATWLSLPQDVGFMCVNSLSDRLTLAGDRSTDIKTYDLTNGSLLWADQVFPLAATPRFVDLYCAENDVLVALYDRELRAYATTGALTWNTPTGNFGPETLFADEAYIVVEMELVGDDDHFLFVYNRSGHALLWQLDVPMDVVSICALRAHEVLLFGNENGNAKVLHYDVAANAYWQPRTLPAGKLIKAERMDGLTFALAHQNGLYSYTYSPNYLHLISSGTPYQKLCFDVDRNTLLAADGSILHELATDGAVLGTITAPDIITDIAIHYTR